MRIHPPLCVLHFLWSSNKLAFHIPVAVLLAGMHIYDDIETVCISIIPAAGEIIIINLFGMSARC